MQENKNNHKCQKRKKLPFDVDKENKNSFNLKLKEGKILQIELKLSNIVMPYYIYFFYYISMEQIGKCKYQKNVLFFPQF